MVRSLFCALVFVAGLATREALAQTAVPPVEIGLDASALLTPDGGGLARGPRLIINFDGRNALEITASLQALSASDALDQRETDLYLAAFKRVVHATGPVRVFGTLGGGLERTLIVVPGSVLPGPPPVTFPPSTGRQLLPAFTVGSGIDLRISRRAAIVFESSFVVTDRFSGRLTGGLVLPVGAYPAQPGRLAASVPWGRLSEGDRAWVTTDDGREVVGEVVLRSATRLAIRTEGRVTSFGPDEVRAIDTTDPVRNGVVLGSKIGGLSALAPSVLVTYLICALEECGVQEVLAVNAAFFGMGAGIGAITGALADSLREGRAPLYRRGGANDVVIAPLLRKQGFGVGAVIGW
jgi:hypothetical protein